MITFLTGDIVEIADNSVTLDVAGTGYLLHTPTSVTGSVRRGDKNVTIHTSLIFADNRLDLYGFSSPDERDVFDLLITVSGIGPKAAVKLLSIPKSRLLEAIAAEDIAILTTVPGIGPKTAKRVVLELKDKISKLFEITPGAAPIAAYEAGSEVDTAVQALRSLGYSIAEIRNMLKTIPADKLEKMPASNIIQLSLKRKE